MLRSKDVALRGTRFERHQVSPRELAPRHCVGQLGQRQKQYGEERNCARCHRPVGLEPNGDGGQVGHEAAAGNGDQDQGPVVNGFFCQLAEDPGAGPDERIFFFFVAMPAPIEGTNIAPRAGTLFINHR